MPHQQNRPVQPPRPETHLLATIRGLQYEMQAKEKEMAKLNRELSDAKASNRRLQQERQRLLNEASPLRPKQASAPPAAEHDPDPDLVAENRGLRRDLQRLQEDLLSLHAKRVGDLTRLQAKHEEELESVVCERVNERLSERSCEGRVAELQGQLYTQQLVIAHLKEQLKHSEHSGEEVSLLKRERDQLEKSVVSLTKQLARLKEASSPDTLRVTALQEQVIELEARHESRERKLQAIVRDLLQQRRGPQGPGDGQGDACCSASVRLLHKNRDLCFYRAEMDRLLDALRELERERDRERGRQTGAGPSTQ